MLRGRYVVVVLCIRNRVLHHYSAVPGAGCCGSLHVSHAAAVAYPAFVSRAASWSIMAYIAPSTCLSRCSPAFFPARLPFHLTSTCTGREAVQPAGGTTRRVHLRDCRILLAAARAQQVMPNSSRLAAFYVLCDTSGLSAAAAKIRSAQQQHCADCTSLADQLVQCMFVSSAAHIMDC
jgi:hypothetical protein